VDDVRQYLITQINGTGNSQRSAVAMIQEFAESGTVRGVVPTVTPGPSLDARRSGAKMIWYMLQREDSLAVFPVENANVAAQFVGIGPDSGNGPSVLTGAQLLEIQALATQTVSRAAELGFTRPILESDVNFARTL
jgi:hypothetical protein